MSAETAVTPPARLTSLDAYRGAIMLLMASHAFGIKDMAWKGEGSFWTTVAWWFDHVAWAGCSPWDLIQPALMFMVGVSVPYSYARRSEQGHSFAKLLGHALRRAAILILIAVLLSSKYDTTVNWEFTNVLAQIGLGYPFLLFLLNRQLAVQAGVTAAILVGYWTLFALYPLPAAGFSYVDVGVTPDEISNGAVFDGFFGHWSKNSNVAAAFDVWFLNLFPRTTLFEFNSGGYATLNFVPSLATMIIGLMCGDLLRSPRTSEEKLHALRLSGMALFIVGVLAGFTLCPIVKRIWTPSWVLVSGGLVVWLLAAFYWVIDVAGFRKWAQFLIVVGMNPMAIYLMSQLMRPLVSDILGAGLFSVTFGPVFYDCLALLVFWLICWWMYRLRVFLRI